jgi:hypothetical protein
MQMLLVTGAATITTSLGIYLPYDKAPTPFGDPLAATLTIATPTVITVPGYIPTGGDAVSISVAGNSNFLSSLAGLTSISLQLGTTYYVVGTSIAAGTNAFVITTQKGGVAPATVEASITSLAGGNVVAGQVFVHLLSNQADGSVIPFKPGNTVICYNAGLNTGLNNSGSPGMNLYGSPDLNTTLATGSYGAPLGPSGWVVLATFSGAPIPQIVQLKYDWICASGSTGTLVMLQN